MINFLKKLYQKNVWLPLALLVFAIQLLVPGYMIFEQQQTLKHGELYKFKVRPIDPYDPFRGRYVVLSFEAEQNHIPLIDQDKDNYNYKRHAWVYANLSRNEKGYAVFDSVTIKKPEGNNYIRVKSRFYSVNKKLRVHIPFDRYYAPEHKALAIETNVQRRSRNNDDEVYVAVKIRNGKGTIEDLFINDTPILEFVENLRP